MLNMLFYRRAVETRAPVRRIAARAAILLLLAGLAPTVQAQEITSGSIKVEPLTAAANTTRRISLHGVWPNGCPPASASVVSETQTAPRTLTLRLNEIFTLAACTQVLTPFNVELDYTPKSPGLLHINLVLASGRVAATGMLGVADASGASANLSGTWFDGPQVGSILMITHSVAQPAALIRS